MLTRRDRVRGSGLGRDHWPNHLYLLTLPVEVVKELKAFCQLHSQTNDINTTHYPIAATEHCPMLATMSPNYQDICLQFVNKGENPGDEKSYTQWTERVGELSQFRAFMDQHFPRAYRTRINILPPGEQLDWHIDTNTSYGCRVYIPISHPIDRDCEFLINRRNQVSALKLEQNKAYFVNTAFPHKVTNHTESKRMSLVFGIESQELLPWL